MGSVIDMVRLNMFHTSQGLVQRMHRRDTGHVEVSVTEFGGGFSMPDSASFGRSQVWSERPLPNQIRFTNSLDMRVPLEALLLALAIRGLDAGCQLVDAGGAATGASRRPTFGGSAGAFGEAGAGHAAEGGRATGSFKEGIFIQGPNDPTCSRRSWDAPAHGATHWTLGARGLGVGMRSDRTNPEADPEWNTVLVHQAPTYKIPQSIKEEKAAKKAAKSTGTSLIRDATNNHRDSPASASASPRRSWTWASSALGRPTIGETGSSKETRSRRLWT